MKRILGMAMMLISGLSAANQPAAARAKEMKTVRVPFAFVAGNRWLPAGSYQVELLTQARPVRDAVEVLVLRGTDAHSYVAMVARVEAGNGRMSNLTFQQDRGRPILREMEMKGVRFELAQPETHERDAREGTRKGQVTLMVDGSEVGDPLGQP
jgi:hypothetical protein